MKADRLLSELLLLQTRGRMTARELAQILEVSERTIYRDLDALSAAGIPVYAEPGPGGGCILSEGYRTSLTGLASDEVRGLFMASVPGPLSDLGIGKVLEEAFLKLLASLPLEQQRKAEHARRRVYLDARGWFRHGETLPHLHTLQEAVWQDRRVRLCYERSDGSISERLVEPYGLVAKASIWYLIGATADGLRVFRVSRVKEVSDTGKHFSRLDDFDLANYWTHWSKQFEESKQNYPVLMRVSAELTSKLPRIFGETLYALIEHVQTDEDERITLRITFPSRDEACSQLLGIGITVEVLDPPELRDMIAKRAAEVVSLYAEPSSTRSNSVNSVVPM